MTDLVLAIMEMMHRFLLNYSIHVIKAKTSLECLNRVCFALLCLLPEGELF